MSFQNLEDSSRKTPYRMGEPKNILCPVDTDDRGGSTDKDENGKNDLEGGVVNEKFDHSREGVLFSI